MTGDWGRIRWTWIAVGLMILAAPTTADESIRFELPAAEEWEASPTWLGNPAAHYGAGDTTGGVRFEVSDPFLGMKWAHRLEQRLEVPEGARLVFRYRARAVAPTPEYFVHVHGRKGQREREVTAPLGQVVADGRDRSVVVEAGGLEVDMVALHVQAGATEASVELREIRVVEGPVSVAEGAPPVALPLDDWPKDHRSVSVSGDLALREWYERAGYMENPVPSGAVIADGLPFRVAETDRALRATPMEEDGEVVVDLGGVSGTVLLLMAAEFEGEEMARLGSGKVSSIREPHRFVVALRYADGVTDLVFPEHAITGERVIHGGMAAYRVRPPRPEPLESLALVDRFVQGRFLLAAVTLAPYAAEPEQSESRPERPLRTAEALPEGAIAGEGTALVVKDGAATALVNRRTSTQWLETASPLYDLNEAEGVAGELKAAPTADGAVALTLTLTNTSDGPVRVGPSFPVLRGLSPGGDPQDLGICYPALRGVVGRIERLHRSEPYSGRFPLQFIDVWHPEAGGVYVMTQDVSNSSKTYRLQKEDGVDIAVEHGARVLEPGERWTLPTAVVGAHEGDWHAGFEAYREWTRTWYTPQVPRQAWFQEVFNLRQLILFVFPPCLRDAFDPETKTYAIEQVIEEDAAELGGADYVHFFDWCQGGAPLGDYEPWEFLGGADTFREEVRKLQDRDIPVGLYLQGLYISRESRLAKSGRGEDWTIRLSDGRPYSFFGDLASMCSSVREWQDYLIGKCVEAVETARPNGLYLDSLGFSDVACYGTDHGHAVPASTVAGEAELTRRVREALPDEVVLYTEEAGTDATTQYKDGAFTYAIHYNREALNPSFVNLARFALPSFKTFEILVCDMPVKDDVAGILHIFFNGEGTWIEGHPPVWIHPKACAALKKTHGILRAHREAFRSENPEPLVATGDPDVYANRFPGSDETVWTLYNAAYETRRGELLSVAHVPGATYYDAWNDRPLEPRIADGRAHLTLEIGPHDVGCVVQTGAPR